MSWMPSADPILGDKRSCDALELVVVPRVRDLGDGFEVRRALPSDKRQMVGPFIFFDQMGPAQFLAGHGLNVRPHPHIGLVTVTYLFDGRVMHRDSEGNALEITPGAMNLMTAGRGIAHSERTPANARRGCEGLFGIQSWIALPEEQEEIEPSFQHFDATDLPVVDTEGLWARVVAGSVFGKRSRVGMFSEWFYAEVVLEPGRAAPLDPDYEERAIYVVEGEVAIAGELFEAPRLFDFPSWRPDYRAGYETCAPDVSRRLRVAGTALHLVEFCLLTPPKNRAGKGRLEVGSVLAGARRNRVHSPPGELARAKTRAN
jgi:redox-sensitive bicupin YhaK (pirin superfamily)